MSDPETPTGFVIDASIIVASLVPEVDSGRARDVLEHAFAGEVVAPAHLAFEVANALTTKLRRNLIDPAYRDAALEAFLGFDIKVDTLDRAVTLRRIQALADRQGLTVHDAAYLEVAVREGFGLATLDDDLARAARREGVVARP